MRSSRWPSRALLVVLIVLVAWVWLSGGEQRGGVVDGPDEEGDSDLYAAVADRVAGGSDYYAAVAAEQVERGYPTRPVPTVREPVVTWVVAAIGETGAENLLRGLAVVALLVGIRFLERASPGRATWVVGALLLLSALAPQLAGGVLVYFHEVWAAPLVVIGLLSRRSTGSNGWSAACLTAAAMVRELAAPVLLVVAVVAWRGGRRRETAAMLAGFVAWAAFYAWHTLRVLDAVPPGAEDSAGWTALGGWPFAVEALRFNSALALVPLEVAAVLVPLALLGWFILDRQRGWSIPAVLAGYAVALALFARPDNAYWGMLMTPLLLPGLAAAPAALGVLLRGAAGGRRAHLVPKN